MTEILKSSTQRVQAYLNSRGFDLRVQQIPETTRTAAEAAKAVNCDVSCIAKSLIFQNRDNHEPLLIIASGGNRVDLEKAGEVIGSKLERADAGFARKHTGYSIGGIPPVAHVKPINTLLDQDLRLNPVIWAAAGTPNSLFSLTPDELQDLTGASWAEIAED
ncbi:MAG: YbaK/EbsC family protein [Gammaproteobacteria bacterium]|nr:YbaK/EbsC family protein [Gammaproteobacteria bacterium]MCY4228800.1 YbaK/EbsC family protein [Gammaproteobacteria bacterium]